MCRVKPGEDVVKGQPLLELHTEEPERLTWARDALEGAIVVGDQTPVATPIVLEVIK
jgi:thymidine phosphorylase